ncbi:MAG TPA: adenylate/guanylate cyclase domain-containing protein [Rhizomicrobium sp.]
MKSVVDWFAQLGLPQYAQRFVENDVDLDVLGGLNEDDLKELGVASFGHRRKILAATGALRGAAKETSRPSPQAAQTPRDAAERRQLSVMFCDLVDSTALSARLDPEEMRKVIAAYHAACSPIVAEYDGLVAKFMGDGILAYFGYPRAHEDDAERAVRASLAIAAAVARLKTSAPAPLKVRIGIATGLVVVGELIGEGAAQEQTVVGDAPNLAARLQSLAAPGAVVVSAATRRLIGSVFHFHSLGHHALKGFAEPVEAWSVEGLANSENRFEAAHLQQLTGFVGRETESALLLERLRMAWSGEGQIVLISGEAGIGKSRFAAWLADQVMDRPHTRMRYQCSPYHRESALYPMVQQIERTADFRADDTPETKLAKLEGVLGRATPRVVEIAPLLASLLSIPFEGRYPPLNLSPAQQRRQTLAALLEQLEGLARRTPVLALFEDAHWADATSLELVNLAVERLRQLPILFLITFRPEFEPPWEGLENVTRLALGNLDGAQVETMVARMTGGRALPAEVMAQIVAKTDGVPLFVEELTKTIQESGILVDEGDGYRLDGPLPPLAIPSTLQDSLMARLDRLTPLKEIVQTGAAIGREFSFPMLQAVIGQDHGALEQALAQLEDAGMLYRTGVLPEARYTFKHALVQDAAYESLLKSRRQILHLRIAEVLCERFAGVATAEPEIVAFHFAQAAQVAAAIEWWTKAGDLALRRAAFPEGAAHLRKTVEMADRPASDGNPELPIAARLKLQLAYGQALLHAKGWVSDQTIAAFARARAMATGIEDPAERMAIYYGLASSSAVRGELAAMRETADAFLSDASKLPGSPEEGVAHRLVGVARWFAGDYAGARGQLEQAVAGYDETKHAALAHVFGQDTGMAAKSFLALTLWPLGEVNRARQMADDALALARRSGHVPTLAYALFYACLFEAVNGNFARGGPHADALFALCQEHTMPVWGAAGAFMRGWSLYQRGERKVGLSEMRGGLALFRHLGIAINLPFLGFALAQAEFEMSGAAAGLSGIEETLAENERSGQRWLDSVLHRLHGDLLLRADPADTTRAEAAYRRAIAIAREQATRSFALQASLRLARLRRAANDAAGAAEVLRAALAGFTPSAEFPEIAEALALI